MSKYPFVGTREKPAFCDAGCRQIQSNIVDPRLRRLSAGYDVSYLRYVPTGGYTTGSNIYPEGRSISSKSLRTPIKDSHEGPKISVKGHLKHRICLCYDVRQIYRHTDPNVCLHEYVWLCMCMYSGTSPYVNALIRSPLH